MNNNTFSYKLAEALPKGISWRDADALIHVLRQDDDPDKCFYNTLSKLDILDCDDYLLRYPDVKKAGADPLMHFIRFGFNEGRFMRLKGSRDCMRLKNGTPAEALETSLPAKTHASNNILELAYIADRDYLIPTFVSIYSLYFHRASNIFYDVNIVAIDLDREVLEPIKALETPNFRINFFLQNDIYEKFKPRNYDIHVSTSAIFKLLLPKIFSHYDRLLYIDADTTIHDDLSSLLEVNLDGAYLACVVDAKATYTYRETPQQRLKYAAEYYFNSGVMLLNLKKMRADRICDALLAKRAQIDDVFMDQDTLNCVLYSKARFLDWRHNFMFHELRNIPLQQLRAYWECGKNLSPEELLAAAKIVHYASKSKPWNNPQDDHAFIWHDYFYLLKKKLRLNLKLNWGQEARDYWIKHYYYSDIGIDRFPGYHELYIWQGQARKTRYIEHEALETAESMPICRSPYKSPVYVNLTTTPDRLGGVYPTLYSLINQSLRPEKIVLWLAKDEFGSKLSLPEAIERSRKFGVEVRIIPRSFKSYNKLVPALETFPDRIHITCDDDIFYEKDWLKSLYTAHLKEPHAIFALRSRELRLDKDGNPLPYAEYGIARESASGRHLIPTGVGGVLYPRGCFHPDITDSEKFMRLAPYADDLWFWAMGVLGGSQESCLKTGMRALVYTDIEREYGGNTLSRFNVDNKNNDVQLANILAAYPQLGEILRASQF